MKTLAVTSGKGGVGKTSLTANLCIALADAGQRVVAFDADLGLANLDILLGVRPAFNLQHVVAEEKALKEVVEHVPSGIGFIGGGSAIYSLLHAGPKRLGGFLAQLNDLAETTDFLVFDTSAGIDNKVMTFLTAADEVLLVATPDPASITDAYAVAKTLFKKRPDAIINVVVNQVLSADEGKAVFHALQRVVQTFLDKDLNFYGHVRTDGSVGQASRSRNPFVVASPKSAAASDVRATAQRVLMARVSAPGGALTANLLEDSPAVESRAA